MAGLVTQQRGGFTDVSQRMAHVARAKVTINGFCIKQMRIVRQQVKTQLLVQFVKRGAVANGNVIDLVSGRHIYLDSRLRGNDGIRNGGGEEVDLAHVFDKAEIAAGFSVAVDKDRFVFNHAGDPLRDNGGVSAIRVLAWAEDVEIAQADGVKTITARKHVGIQFVDVFGDRIRRQRFADLVFHFGQAGMVAIGRAGGGIDEALDLGIACGDQHVEEAADIGVIGGDGVFERARDRA